MAVVNMVVGATTETGATFVAKVNGGGPVRVAVADNDGMAGPVFTASQAVDAQGVAKVSITGLTASSQWWWRVEDNGVVDNTVTGQFRTHPPVGVPGNFSVALAACAGSNPFTPGVGAVLASDRLSNHTVFTNIVDRDPLFTIHMGDLHYYDLGNGVVGTGSLANYRRAYDDVLLQPNQQLLYRSVPLVYTWDNHDWGRDLANESDGTLPDAANAQAVYRERVPHYPLSDPNGIWQERQVARVQFVVLDSRSFRDPNADPDGPTKTMLGSAQKTWLEGVLQASTAEFLVVISSSCWINPPLGADTWESFATERAELVQMFTDTGWLNRMAIFWADRHAMGIDTGSNMVGGMPGGQFAPLDDANPSGGATWFDTGPEGSETGQYGVVTFTDLGSVLAVSIAGWQGPNLWRNYQFGINIAPSTPIASGALLRTLSGSHRAIFGSRLLTTFQNGDDPSGTELQILDGDVVMDAEANIQRTLNLEVRGTDPDSNESAWPRQVSDPMSPYGDEVFIQRGVSLGAQQLLFPLGYFRIQTLEQDDAPYGPIRITGLDRMSGIIDGAPLAPREFEATRSVASVFAELVGEIYPNAIIAFDDDSGAADLGRVVVMEESRFEVLAEIATGLGKIMYWDGIGVLQIRTVPDETVPVWEVRAGWDGVLISASRRITREGVHNGWVFTGEGGATDVPPAIGMAVDNGANSPTKWGGRFGKVPGFFSSPTITTDAQAQMAAVEKLRASIGAPYNVDFGSIVNPSLQPYDPVRVTHQDYNREIHVMQRLTIPLSAERAMTATTKEKTLVVISSAPEVILA